MSISLSKWAVMGTLALVSGLVGATPYFLMRRIRGMKNVFNESLYHLSLTVLACFGGGVLMATTLVHMLPENRLSLAAHQSLISVLGDHFPLTETLTLVGFAFIYFLEELATWIVDMTGLAGVHGPHGQVDLDNRRASVLSIHALSRGSIRCHLDSDISPPTFEGNSENDVSAKSQLGSIFALAALSFHAVMEGIAIGIQNSSNLWLMFGAIASHKFIISFCMGMELCAAKAKPKSYISSISLFAILSPIGILIGSLLTAEDSVKSLPVSILEGFTTGTLLYAVFFEILSRERERQNTVLAARRIAGFLQFLGVVFGAGAMICLLTLIDHGHNVDVTHPEDDHPH